MRYKLITLSFLLLLLTHPIVAQETGTLYLKKVNGKIDPISGLNELANISLSFNSNIYEDASNNILASSFTDRVPTNNEVVSGQHRYDDLGRNAPNLVFWVMIFGLQAGDEEQLEVIAPDGSVLVRKQGELAKKHQIRWFTYTGKRARGPWMTGEYKGKYKLIRTTESGRNVVSETTTTVRIK